MPRPIAPAPNTTAVRPSSPSSRSAAMTTAAWDTEVTERAMAVSVRARLPVSSARRKSRLSVGPAAP